MNENTKQLKINSKNNYIKVKIKLLLKFICGPDGQGLWARGGPWARSLLPGFESAVFGLLTILSTTRDFPIVRQGC